MRPIRGVKATRCPYLDRSYCARMAVGATKWRFTTSRGAASRRASRCAAAVGNCRAAEPRPRTAPPCVRTRQPCRHPTDRPTDHPTAPDRPPDEPSVKPRTVAPQSGGRKRPGGAAKKKALTAHLGTSAYAALTRVSLLSSVSPCLPLASCAAPLCRIA